MADKIIVSVDPDLEDLIPGFLSNREKDVQLITDHLAEDNMDAIRLIGHSMKGAGGGYGFDMITDIGSEIEQAALAGDKEKIASCNDELADYLARVEPVPES